MSKYRSFTIYKLKSFSKNALFFVTLFLTASAWSDEIVEPIQEAFKSDLVFSQEAGEFQFSFTPHYAEADEETSWALPVSLEYGISDNLQVELEWVSYGQNNPDDESASSGVGDVKIGLQYSWMEIGGSNVHLALGVELGVPLGDDQKELGEAEKSLETYVVLGTNISKELHTFLQLGVEYPEHEARERFANVGLIGKLTHDVAFTLEYNWEEEERYVTPGLVWEPADDWELGIGLPVGMGGESDDYQLILHVIVELDS